MYSLLFGIGMSCGVMLRCLVVLGVCCGCIALVDLCFVGCLLLWCLCLVVGLLFGASYFINSVVVDVATHSSFVRA